MANIEAPVTAGDIRSERKLNHVMDCKEVGIKGTLGIAGQNGVRTFGAGFNKEEAARILELPGSGGIGMFSVTYYREFLKAGENKPGCITVDDEETIRENIRKSRRRTAGACSSSTTDSIECCGLWER